MWSRMCYSLSSVLQNFLSKASGKNTRCVCSCHLSWPSHCWFIALYLNFYKVPLIRGTEGELFHGALPRHKAIREEIGGEKSKIEWITGWGWIDGDRAFQRPGPMDRDWAIVRLLIPYTSLCIILLIVHTGVDLSGNQNVGGQRFQ